MKFTSMFILIVAIFCMSFSCYAIPPELRKCGDHNFSFSDLENYNESELVEAYCNCIDLHKLYKNVQLEALNLQTLLLQRFGTTKNHMYIEAEKEGKESCKHSSNAENNASRIFRVLKKNYKFQEAPQCENSQK